MLLRNICGQTDTTENITFPQIRWRALISNGAVASTVRQSNFAVCP